MGINKFLSNIPQLCIATACLLLSSINTIVAQQNIVPNPGFESSTACVFQPNQNHSVSSGPAIIPFLNDWVLPDREESGCKVGSADLNNDCTANVFPNPNNEPNYSEYTYGARTGTNYVQMITQGEHPGRQYREFITAPLISPMITNHLYSVEFYVANNGSDIGNIGAYFSMQRPTVCKSSYITGLPTPQVSSNSLIAHNNDWVLISGTFQAAANYAWITVGNFKDKNNTLITSSTHEIHYIDDVTVLDLGLACCDQIIRYENTSNLPAITKAQDMIFAGYDAGIPNTSGNVNVTNGQDVLFRAGIRIELKDGFTASPGAGRFQARIANCSDNTVLADAGPDRVACIGESLTIGNCPQSGLTGSTFDPICAQDWLVGFPFPTGCPATITIPQSPCVSEVTITMYVGAFGCVNSDEMVLTISNDCKLSNPSDTIMGEDDQIDGSSDEESSAGDSTEATAENNDQIQVDRSSIDAVDVLRIYPNPSSSFVNVDVIGNKDVSLNSFEIFNIYGDQIPIVYQLSPEGKATLDVALLINGIYFLRISTNLGEFVERIEIIK